MKSKMNSINSRQKLLKRYIFVEGETETDFCEAFDFRGQIRQFNPYQDDITKFRYLFDKKENNSNITTILICDCDIEDIKKLNLFKKNIDNLLLLSYKLNLIFQVTNFEEELMYCCKIDNMNKFKKIIQSPSIKEIKATILKMNNLKQKLEKNGFNIYAYGSRYKNMEHLNSYHKYCISFTADLTYSKSPI